MIGDSHLADEAGVSRRVLVRQASGSAWGAVHWLGDRKPSRISIRSYQGLSEDGIGTKCLMLEPEPWPLMLDMLCWAARVVMVERHGDGISGSQPASTAGSNPAKGLAKDLGHEARLGRLGSSFPINCRVLEGHFTLILEARQQVRVWTVPSGPSANVLDMSTKDPKTTLLLVPPAPATLAGHSEASQTCVVSRLFVLVSAAGIP